MVVKECLDKANLEVDVVSKLLIHQANAKMDDAILKRLFHLYGMDRIPAGVMPMIIHWTGNSSVARMPRIVLPRMVTIEAARRAADAIVHNAPYSLGGVTGRSIPVGFASRLLEWAFTRGAG